VPSEKPDVTGQDKTDWIPVGEPESAQVTRPPDKKKPGKSPVTSLLLFKAGVYEAPSADKFEYRTSTMSGDKREVQGQMTPAAFEYMGFFTALKGFGITLGWANTTGKHVEMETRQIGIVYRIETEHEDFFPYLKTAVFSAQAELDDDHVGDFRGSYGYFVGIGFAKINREHIVITFEILWNDVTLNFDPDPDVKFEKGTGRINEAGLGVNVGLGFTF
jgi:hypothetical protein